MLQVSSNTVLSAIALLAQIHHPARISMNVKGELGRFTVFRRFLTAKPNEEKLYFYSFLKIEGNDTGGGLH